LALKFLGKIHFSVSSKIILPNLSNMKFSYLKLITLCAMVSSTFISLAQTKVPANKNTKPKVNSVAVKSKSTAATKSVMKFNSAIDSVSYAVGVLVAGNFKGFTDTFEDLHGMAQLPGIASQRLMAKGYGFGGEGDWKTAALVRAMKVMGTGLQGGNSFMEDYTYHFNPSNRMVLGAHMLEICESIADAKPNCEIHPLGIGGKADPVRLVFNSAPGPALNASIVDMGNRFRLLVNEVLAVAPVHALPKLPVARVLWKPYPNMHTGCAAWIYAGGAHHTCYSQNLTSEHLEDFAAMAGIEFSLIGKETTLHQFKNELKWSDVYYHLNKQ
jgi:L-arabinose isomerase